MSFDLEAVRTELASAADEDTAHRHGKQLRCLRGIRGVPNGSLARIADRVWRSSPTKLPRDVDRLDRLFATAWEDGLLAIGLLATATADAPGEAHALAMRMALRVDDHVTADALGWLVFGPSAAHLRKPYPVVVEGLVDHARPEIRRIAVSGALAFTPLLLEGPSASPLRAQLGQAKIQISDRIDPRVLGWAITTFRRDEGVARAVRRLIIAWGDDDPAALVQFVDTLPGGLPSMLANEVRPYRRPQ